MRVLVLGGTGAIGSNLVHILSENGVETTVTSRSHHVNIHATTYVCGNAKDNSFLKKLCSKKWDAIVDFMSYKTEEFANRLELLLTSTKQYVFISSSRVYADEEHPIKETSPRLLDVSKDTVYLVTDEYALTKARQENLLMESPSHNFTIVRPYITYDKCRLQLGVMEKEEWLFRALLGHTVVFPSDMIDKRTTMTHGYDVALGIFNLLGKQNAIGEVFHITTSHSNTWSEIIDIYKEAFKEATGKDLKVSLVPVDVFLRCRLDNLIWQVKYDRLFNRDFDITKESTVCSPSQFKATDKYLKDCLIEFIKDGPNFKHINIKYEAIKDKLTKERLCFTAPISFRQKLNYLLYRYIL